MSQPNPFAAPDASGTHSGSGGTEQITYEPASSWTRLFAYLIDSLIAILLLVTGLVAVFGAVFALSPEAGDALLADDNPMVDLVSRGIGFLVPTVYGALFEASPWMATPGKRLFGLVVVDAEDEALDIGQAIQRNFVKNLALSCCGLLAFTAVDGRPGIWNDSAGYRVVRRV